MRCLRPIALATALVTIGAAAAAAAVSSAVGPVVLPRDHGAHPGFQSEWWYTAGTVAGSSGRLYFWFATEWASPMGTIARANLVDLHADRVVLSREFVSLTRPALGQTSLPVRDFTLTWHPGGARGRWSVNARVGTSGLTLTLLPRRPYLLHGRSGVIQQGPGGLSAYYSEPRLAADGVVKLAGKRAAVRGVGWLDHQWGNFLADPGALRWNWFACQLADGRNLMLYQFLDRRDQPSGIVAGTMSDSRGRTVHLHRFSASALAPFVHPVGAKASYPLGWRLHVPALRLTLTLRARARNQYIANQLIPSFWEGAAAITNGPPGSCIVESSREIPSQFPSTTASARPTFTSNDAPNR